MGDAARLIHWNGRDVPEALRDLPPGEYVLERVYTAAEAGLSPEGAGLTPEQEEGILRAMESADRGALRPWDEVRAELEARFNLRRAG